MKFKFESDDFNLETESIDIAKKVIDIWVRYRDTGGAEPCSVKADIPNDTYLIITADDITYGGKSVTEYSGQKIAWCGDCIEYVRDANDLFKKEYDAELLELHVLQANTMFDNPIPDVNGKFVWLRCVFKVDGKRKVSRWVFRRAYSSVADCRSFCPTPAVTTFALTPASVGACSGRSAIDKRYAAAPMRQHMPENAKSFTGTF